MTFGILAFRIPVPNSFCCSHILRELIRVAEETNQEWSKKLIDLLLQAKELKESYHPDGIPIPPVIRERIDEAYDELIQVGLAENPPPTHLPGKRGRKKFSNNLKPGST